MFHHFFSISNYFSVLYFYYFKIFIFSYFFFYSSFFFIFNLHFQHFTPFSLITIHCNFNYLLQPTLVIRFRCIFFTFLQSLFLQNNTLLPNLFYCKFTLQEHETFVVISNDKVYGLMVCLLQYHQWSHVRDSLHRSQPKTNFGKF